MKNYIVDILNNKWFIALLYIMVCCVLLKTTDIIFKGVRKKKKPSVVGSFLMGLIKVIIVIFGAIRIASLSNIMSKFANTILMSSSLLVVVLGFIFQEGLSNIIHGFIITIFKPFDINDRVEINMSSGTISGYVKAMTLRHTVIVSITDHAESIIPNSVLDNSVIRNLTTQDQSNRYPIIINIPYSEAQNHEKLANIKKIISETILEDPLTIDIRDDKNQPLFVKVDFTDSGVALTSFIDTHTLEDNFIACSNIKEKLLQKFKESGVQLAYNHIEISGALKTD